jgi:hypothetical protein
VSLDIIRRVRAVFDDYRTAEIFTTMLPLILDELERQPMTTPQQSEFRNVLRRAINGNWFGPPAERQR